MFYPTIEHIEGIISELSRRYGEEIVITNIGQLEFALEKPQLILFGKEMYPEFYQKVAILMETINKGHWLSDGNKRTAMMAAEYMVIENGYELVLPLKSIRFSVDVAKDKDDQMLDEIMQWFKVHIAMNKNQLYFMLKERVEEEAMIKYHLKSGNYDEVEKIIDHWLSFDSYPQQKAEWEKYVEDWKRSEVSPKEKILETEELGSSHKWKTLVKLAKYDGKQYFGNEEVISSLTEAPKQEFIGHSASELCNHYEEMQEYEQKTKKSKNSEESHRQGITLESFGYLKHAIICYNEMLEINPKNVDALSHKASVIHDMNDYDKAIPIYLRILELTPKSNFAMKNLCFIYGELERYGESLHYANLSLEVDPADARILERKGIALTELGKEEEALNCLKQAIEINPNDWMYLDNMATSLSKFGKSKEALEYAEKALVIQPNNPEIWYNKGLIVDELGEYDKAIDCWDKTMVLNPDFVEAIVNKGALLSNLKKYEEAIPYFEKALKLESNHKIALSNLGITFLQLKKYDEAQIFIDKALLVDENYDNAVYYKSELLFVKGKTEESLKMLEKSIGLDPSYKEVAMNSPIFESIKNDKKFKGILSKSSRS